MSILSKIRERFTKKKGEANMPSEGFIRTPTRAAGGITEEEKAKMAVVAQKWIAIALRTDPIEPEKIIPAIKRLYAAADLAEPTVVIVPSPLCMALTGVLATTIWSLREQGNGDDPEVIAEITGDVLKSSTEINDTTKLAVIRAVAEAAPPVEWKGSDKPLADHLTEARKILKDACYNWRFAHQGGNMWAGSPAYYEAMRDVIGLTGLDCWVKYAPWEECAIHGSFRYLHEKFCVVSDFPSALKTDDNHRPHCADGPSHAWRDDWRLYHISGVRVPEQVIMAPETITGEQITQEQNAEVRRVMIERMGWERFCEQVSMNVIHTDQLNAKFPTVPVTELVEPGQRFVYDYRSGTETAELLQAEGITDLEDRPLKFVRLTDPSTGRRYTLRVPHTVTRCYEGIGWSFGLSEADYKTKFYIRHGDVGLIPLTETEGRPSQHS
jgi:hypothetical protein